MEELKQVINLYGKLKNNLDMFDRLLKNTM